MSAPPSALDRPRLVAWHVSECPGAGHAVKWPRDVRRRPYHRSGGTTSAACQAWSSTRRRSTRQPGCADPRLRRAAPGSSPRWPRGLSGSGRPLRETGARSDDAQTSSKQPGGAASTISGEPCLAGQRLMRQSLEGARAHSSCRARWRSRPADGDRGRPRSGHSESPRQAIGLVRVRLVCPEQRGLSRGVPRDQGPSSRTDRRSTEGQAR